MCVCESVSDTSLSKVRLSKVLLLLLCVWDCDCDISTRHHKWGCRVSLTYGGCGQNDGKAREERRGGGQKYMDEFREDKGEEERGTQHDKMAGQKHGAGRARQTPTHRLR